MPASEPRIITAGTIARPQATEVIKTSHLCRRTKGLREVFLIASSLERK